MEEYLDKIYYILKYNKELKVQITTQKLLEIKN